MHRSLSQFADSLAVSEARALEWERMATRLQLESAALRSRLEAPPSLKEMPAPTAASSQPPSSSSSDTPRLAPDAGRIRYPATLPVSGAQPAGDWHGFLQRWHARTAGACMSGPRVPGFCSFGDAKVSTACDRGRRCCESHAAVALLLVAMLHVAGWENMLQRCTLQCRPFHVAWLACCMAAACLHGLTLQLHGASCMPSGLRGPCGPSRV